MCETAPKHGKEDHMNRRKLRVPKAVYYQAIWIIKDLDRLRRLEAAGSYGHTKNEFVFFVDDEEIIRDSGVLEQARFKLDCVRDALALVPEEYRQKTIDSIIYGIPFDDMAHENTWRKWRQFFIRELAKNLMLI